MSKKKMYSKLLCLVLSLLFVFQPAIISFAVDSDHREEETEPVDFTYISISTCSCSISGLILTANAGVSAKNTASLSIVMEVQKLKSGSYETVKTWSASKTGLVLNMSETQVINVFSTYRLKATVKANGETDILYSYA